MCLQRMASGSKLISSQMTSISALRPVGRVLERAGTDGADLRAQDRHGDDRHDLAADGGLDELDVAGLGIILQLHGVGGAAGVELHGEARREVAAVDRAADEDGGGVVLLREDGEGVGVGVGVEVIIAGAADVDDAVHAALPHLVAFLVRQVAEDDGIELVAGHVAELSQLAAELQAHGRGGLAVVLDVGPHVFIIRFLHRFALLKSNLFPPGSPRASSRRTWRCRC